MRFEEAQDILNEFVKDPSLLDKYLLAVDELTGFIIAASLMRPTVLVGMKSKSVKKKLKTKGFAAGVDRDETYKSLEISGLELDEHVDFMISVLLDNVEQLEIQSELR